ncbi:MAG TPA: tetraacyldisaccharide 4'-kinase [Acidobacteriota bacterium]|nr:tetraacyldisaccharide 4'-kinase [Acidobacteriota bacterium]
MYKPLPSLAPLLYVPSLLFGAVVRLRNLSYSRGALRSARLPRPVISIGNLTLGGTGKTPLVIHLAATLLRLGHQTAILSRGFGRHRIAISHVLQPRGDGPLHTSHLGDEAALIRRRLPEAWLGISTDRFAVGRKIAGLSPGVVFVLDDGFQHRQLHRDLDIVVIDPTQPLGENHLFPLGSLREPVSGLRRCHAVVLNGGAPAAVMASIASTLADINAHARIFHCTQKIDLLVPFGAWIDSTFAPTVAGRCARSFLTAALGNPRRFRADVENLGTTVTGCRFFRDHHILTRQEWRDCVRQADRAGAEAIIITEKDAVKIVEPPDFPLLVALQSVRFDRPAEFEQMLTKVIQGIP